MKHSELIDAVAAKLEVSKADAKASVEAVFGAVTEALVKGDGVSVKDFGAFAVKVRPAGTVRNPQTGEIMQVAEKKQAKFKASSVLANAVNV